MIEYGFEKFDYYIAAAQRLGVACEQRDLSDLDNQPSWEVPDIVFTARPFKNDLLEVELGGSFPGDMTGAAPATGTHINLHGQEAVWLDYTLPRYISVACWV